jgi:hypothetical protein
MGLPILKGDFLNVLIKHCFIRHPSDSVVSEDAIIEPIIVVILGFPYEKWVPPVSYL